MLKSLDPIIPLPYFYIIPNSSIEKKKKKKDNTIFNFINRIVIQPQKQQYKPIFHISLYSREEKRQQFSPNFRSIKSKPIKK